ncbi:MAG: ATP-dependent DNA ligase [candidate division WOR-3 bacterium]|nr:ATP-dependent DNA ligase [candidate division WOR-3 bacterium]
MLFKAIVEYSERVRQTSSRNSKISIIEEFLSKLSVDEALIGVNYIAGRIRQGKLNIAWKGITELSNTVFRRSRSPSLVQVDRYLELVCSARGRKKIEALTPLFTKLGKDERKYLVLLMVGEVQQGAGEGVVKHAIARFFGLSDEEIERAYLQKPDIAELFFLLRSQGKEAIDSLGISIFSPVKPMLAQMANSLDDVFDENEEFALEHKLDGIRIQTHRDGDKVKIFSRHLKDITDHFPELVQNARQLPVTKFILDGEAIGIDKKGRPVRFQVLARRTTRKKNIIEMQREVPVLPQYFDALYVGDEDLTGKTYAERVEILNDVVRRKRNLAARLIPVSKNKARTFYDQSLELGNEGVVVKLLGSEYRPGKRGKFWFKLKGTHTVDCVILAAEWGHGRRHGFLSNLHLGVLDETKTKYLMVGKTFKGLTDKMLQWMTVNLPRYKVHEDEWTVYVRPVVVVEIVFNEVQKSPKYESGVALRFARVKKLREDKTAQEINTIIDLESISAVSSKGP